MKKAIKILTGVALLSFAAGTVSAQQAPLWLGDWYPEIDLEVRYDDNVNRSFDGDGQKSDIVFQPELRIEQQLALGERLFGYAAGTVHGEVYGRYNKLNFIAPGFDVGIRQQVGQQPETGALSAGLAMWYEFHNQDPRFGAIFQPRLSADFEVASALTLSLFYQYDNRFASENSVYDREGHTIGLGLAVPVSDVVTIMMGYDYRNGSVLVHEPLDDLGVEVRGSRLPVDTFRERFEAVRYRDADTHTLALGLQYEVSLYTSVRGGIVYEDIRTSDDSYPSMQLRFGLSHLL